VRAPIAPGPRRWPPHPTTFYSSCSVVGGLGGAVPVPEQVEP
jgi:hypothetical protein